MLELWKHIIEWATEYSIYEKYGHKNNPETIWPQNHWLYGNSRQLADSWPCEKEFGVWGTLIYGWVITMSTRLSKLVPGLLIRGYRLKHLFGIFITPEPKIYNLSHKNELNFEQTIYYRARHQMFFFSTSAYFVNGNT